MAEDQKKLLTIPEVAEILSVSAGTVRNLIKGGSFPVARFGESVRIDPEDLQEFIDSAKTISKKEALNLSVYK